MDALADLYETLETKRKSLGLSQHETVKRALGMKGNSALQNIRRGFDPGYTSVAALCRELGLELYIGPPRYDGAFKYDGSLDYSGAPVVQAEPLPAKLCARLHLPDGATEADALAVLDALPETAHQFMARLAALDAALAALDACRARIEQARTGDPPDA